jgi:hypothetical protein
MNILDMLGEDNQQMWRESWASTDASERAEARRDQAEREQRLVEIENAVDKLRISKLHRPMSRAEIFARAEALAAIDDAREAARVKKWRQQGEPVDRDVSVKEHERMKHQREWIAKAAKDPALIKQLERELERRNRDAESYLYHRDLPSTRSNSTGQYVRYGGPITGMY